MTGRLRRLVCAAAIGLCLGGCVVPTTVVAGTTTTLHSVDLQRFTSGTAGAAQAEESVSSCATDPSLVLGASDDGRGQADPDRGTVSWALSTDGHALAELSALVTDGETAPVLRHIYTLPADAHRWNRTPGVTLLGDAAHLTAPNGEGANLALYDAAELGTALAAHPNDIETALADYEQALFPRTATATANAEAPDLHAMLGKDAPHNLIAMVGADGRTS